jgi:hypothetical protein
MTACQSRIPVESAVLTPRESTPTAEGTQEFEAWGRYLLEDSLRLRPGIESLDHWLDLNA